MKRRQFIQTASATSALGAMSFMSGCATIGGNTGPKVVVVGGGYGGATAAKYVRMWSDYGIRVTLVEPNARFHASRSSCQVPSASISPNPPMKKNHATGRGLVKREQREGQGIKVPIQTPSPVGGGEGYTSSPEVSLRTFSCKATR